MHQRFVLDLHCALVKSGFNHSPTAVTLSVCLRLKNRAKAGRVLGKDDIFLLGKLLGLQAPINV